MVKILIIQDADTSDDCLPLLLQELDIEYQITDREEEVHQLLANHPISLICSLSEKDSLRNLVATISDERFIPLLLVLPEENHCKLTPDHYSKLTDFIHLPINKDLFRYKIQFLKYVSRQMQALTQSRQEIKNLRDTINDLHRSVDGHNSFLDLMSRRDGLTGLFNRRHFNAVIKEAFKDSTAGRGDISLLVLNIDCFSEINKSCGQDYGDFVLNELSARITSSSHENDICFRLSGEEFAVIMLNSPIDIALQKAEELRVSCEAKSFDSGSSSRKITVSLGVASYSAHRPHTHDELINMAEHALFIAKSEGRNRVMQHVPIYKNNCDATEKNFKILKESVTRILDKTKVSTLRSLQLLAQGIMEGKESDQVKLAQSYAQLLSHELRFPPTLIDTFRNSIVLLSSLRYLLHNEMINKEGTLTANEWDIIADFPYKLGQITNLFDYFSGERTILLHHGEKYDGSGYPEGLKGDEIPIGARIFSLVTAFAAMNSDRPYRKRLSPQQILEELGSNAGKQFDPFLVLKLIDVIEEKGILNVTNKLLDDTRQVIRQNLSL